MSENFQRIYAAVAQIPHGKVTSYGSVAIMAGYTASAARVVGWALKALPDADTIPWQRVVNREGYLTIVNPRVDALEQRRRLEDEGIVVEEVDGLFRVPKQYFL
jgi:methylated-DNA-protein-cysteine methyltransferase-like protein